MLGWAAEAGLVELELVSCPFSLLIAGRIIILAGRTAIVKFLKSTSIVAGADICSGPRVVSTTFPLDVLIK